VGGRAGGWAGGSLSAGGWAYCTAQRCEHAALGGVAG
jgi:hypothetical protein